MSEVRDRREACFPFVVGHGRSGTTLLRLMLNAHPELAIPNESHFIPHLAGRWRTWSDTGQNRTEALADALKRHYRFVSWGLPDSEVRRTLADADPRTYAEAIRSVYALYAGHQGKRRYGDKTPSYVLKMPVLAGLFPESRFVHIVRDGRDVALSLMDVDFGPDSIDEAAIRWRRSVRHGRDAGRQLGPGRYLEVRYETLVSEPEDVLPEICSFLGISFDDAMLRYFETAGSALSGMTQRRRGYHPNVYSPPTVGMRDWRRQMTPDQVVTFEAIAGDALKELGYPTSTRRFTLSQVARARRAELRFRLTRTRGQLSMARKKVRAAAGLN